MKLNARALGFTLGVIWGFAVSLLTLLSLYSFETYAIGFLKGIASVYPGYTISTEGAILGLCYGFVDAFVLGWLIAKIYNFFAKEK